MPTYSYSPGVTDKSGEYYAAAITSFGKLAASKIDDYKNKKDDNDRMRGILETSGTDPSVMEKFEAGSNGTKQGIFSDTILKAHKQIEQDQLLQQQQMQYDQAVRLAEVKGRANAPQAPAVMEASDGSNWYVNPRTGSPMKQVESQTDDLPYGSYEGAGGPRSPLFPEEENTRMSLFERELARRAQGSASAPMIKSAPKANILLPTEQAAPPASSNLGDRLKGLRKTF